MGSLYFRSFLFLTALFQCTVLDAQVMEGIILDAETKTAIQGVTIINRQKGIIVFSDTGGYFSISAVAGDTLFFTHTSYAPVQEIMAFSFGNKYKAILMRPMVYSLEMATINGQTQYQKDSAANRDMFTHGMNQHIIHISPVMNPISYVADKILGISKKAKKFKRDFYTDEQNAFIDTRYTPVLVASLTGLQGDSLAYFMNSYPMEYQYARQASDMEIKMWIRNNYKQYLKKNAKPQ